MTSLPLPDLPRWVEAHGIAADPASWRRPLGDGFAVGSDRARLIVVGGEADPAATAALAAEHTAYTLLVAIEAEDLIVAMRGVGRTAERAILHTLPDPEALPDHEGAAVLPADVPLDHLRPEVAAEIADARGGQNVWAAWVDGVPVAFAHAPWRSEKWFDISVDTDPSARQLGLATIVSAAMIRDQRARGREPVWGADAGNHASLRLARRLGFEPVDELCVIERRCER